MKADCCRYIVKFTDGDAKSKAAESVRAACAEVEAVVKKDLPVTHLIYLDLALNYSVMVHNVHTAKLVEKVEYHSEPVGFEEELVEVFRVL